ncbi:abasic site processing protein HMCES isoform X2 [Tripterygium wilfordii]|uniref:abasic site processing protein HMCES isoform X2 n=1 Tax=Tripterygium wilfordii TaxID=458696 RepID=UPI0018F85E7A|nr:abasic site processing protein HMCES isoform X2 [Tripterygium wilfordii]
MCGRARCTLRSDDAARACHRGGSSVRTVDMDRYRPAYNVSPGRDLPVVRRDDGSSDEAVVLQCMKWGLVPSFTKKTEKPDFFKMFNARSESMREKASFRRLVPKNRCLVAVEGFYEWKKDGSKKQPYYVHFRDGRPLVFAALYDSWENSEGEKLYTFTIITTSSSPTLEWLHDRMPVILGDKESTDLWLNGPSTSKLDMVLKPYTDSDLAWYPVTPAMGKTSFDGPDCIKEIPLKVENKTTISNFFSTKEIKKEQEAKIVERSPIKEIKREQEFSFNMEDGSMEECKKEQESSPKGNYSCDGCGSVETKLDKSMKEEPKTEVDEEKLAFTAKEDPDSNTSAHEGSKCLTKRNDEELLDKSMKEEPKTEVDEEKLAFTAKEDPDSNTSAHEGSKCLTKRNYEELSTDSKLVKVDISKPSTSPARKKASIKNAGDKQSTLHSFFKKANTSE